MAAVCAIVTAVGICACASAPGGPAGEFAESLRSSRSAVLTAAWGINEWNQRNLLRPTARVVLDDAVSHALEAQGIIVALKVESADDERVRARVHAALASSVEAAVAARGVLLGDPGSAAAKSAQRRLERVASGLDTLSEDVSGGR
ncbi:MULTISPECIES: hypothetical protein [Gordonia]|uniref:hypothetical protein n=1 Tax=Gordonia TaxID=2053 RepID=UPI00034D1DF7|nr:MULTISPECIES: hypothetical protein [Gordonia]AUH67475.1 hypothetical protein CXX93_02825 [Gordonia sp. YC-JH1]MBY4568522.1 hypothetical protein [Gordonia sihwensis]